jgi:hypothetical protein
MRLRIRIEVDAIPYSFLKSFKKCLCCVNNLLCGGESTVCSKVDTNNETTVRCQFVKYKNCEETKYTCVVYTIFFTQNL